LVKLSVKVRAKKDRGFFRLPVDRAFSMKGFGTVVTGTVVSGALKVGDEVEILPSKLATKIRGIQSHGKDVSSVQLGDRAALNLSNIDRTRVTRGLQLASKGFIEPSGAIGAEFSLLPSTERVVRNEQRVRIHLGTDEVMAKVRLVNPGKRKVVNPGEASTALIELEKAVAVAIDDPFILRFYSPLETIGGGVIIDTQPPSSWKECKRWLQSLEGLIRSERLKKFLVATENEPLTMKGWSQRWQLSEPVFRELLRSLSIKEFGPKENPFVTLVSSLENQKRACVEAVDNFHEQSPYQRGIPKDRLRQILGFHASLFDYITHELESEKKIEAVEGIVRIQGFHVELTGKDTELASRLEKALKDSLYTPPVIKQLAELIDLPEAKTLQLMHVLKGQGKAEEVSRNLWFHVETLTVMENEIRRFFEDKASMAVNDFKSLTHTTRKHAIPLLEYLDDRRITRREGDQRVLSK
ncbi:MAG: SelB C-terminal domain-containing protein, partial [Candidatus Neomarinimicrobiota bacterium]